MYDVVALGELLIDFTPNGISEQGNVLFERNPGGAPANVLVALSKLGKKTAFIGKVGQDEFGRFLGESLGESQVERKGLVFSEHVNTTLAFVHLKEDGDRSFSFYRKPGADLTLEEGEVDCDLISQGRIFHFGSVSLTGEPSRSATFHAVKYAKQQGLLVSYDPNLREPLWDSLEKAKEVISEGLQYTDVLKVSEEELHFLTGGLELEEGTQYLWDTYKISVIFVTQGSKGCFYRLRENVGMVPAFEVKAMDATGAGDAFLGAVLFQLLESPQSLEQLTVMEIVKYVLFANAAGALTAMRKGAIPALPEMKQIVSFMQNGLM
jgi:sugar/nucleoside kinase (ribokinase family)